MIPAFLITTVAAIFYARYQGLGVIQDLIARLAGVDATLVARRMLGPAIRHSEARSAADGRQATVLPAVDAGSLNRCAAL